MKRLLFTRNAVRDLERLRAFIAEKNPQAAAQVSRRLYQTIRRLSDHPELGRVIEELPGVRELIAVDYIARCTLTDDVVIVLRIWHGKEDR